MNLFRVINDISEESWTNMREKVFMLIKILVGITPKRIEAGERTGKDGQGERRKETGAGRSRKDKQ